MSKPRKADEPQAAYAATNPATSPKKAASPEAEFKRITAKLFAERKEPLHQLAQ